MAIRLNKDSSLRSSADLRTKELAGWGGYPRVQSTVWEPRDSAELNRSFEETTIVRGQGRSYGDAALSKTGVVVLSENLNRELTLNDNGVFRAEAGTTIAQVLNRVVPEGWFPAVVPGTKFVSLGGCLAADVHGKNHHRVGSFVQHVPQFELLLADEVRLSCSAHENEEAFWATAGGMGLTGIVTDVELQLIPVETPFVIAQHHQAKDLEQSLQILNDPELDDEYSVVWLDCLAKGHQFGRGILIRGHHARRDELPPGSESVRARRKFDLKFDFPSWALSASLLATSNSLYYRYQGSRKTAFVQHYDDFFFPLDRIGSWPRLYGKRGFIQYQCLFPLSESEPGIQLMLEELVESGKGAFLAVLKRFGPASPGLLSFPFPGYTLTMDFPMSDDLLPFLNRLDEVVLRFGGRVYLAKDARLSADNFKLMYPRLNEWRSMKAILDPQNVFQSDLSRRLELTPASINH
jgi:FAD/FMN-containing dehydrogenase